VLRRVVSAVVLIALASMPVVARTRLFCRYTGLEITDCAEQQVPATSAIQVAGCCDRQVTRPLGVVLKAQQEDFAPPVFQGLPARSLANVPAIPLAHIVRPAAAPTGPPVFLITRALLI
jgi:hypothetical protein